MGVLMQYYAALSSSLGALSAGCALGWTSNLQHKILHTDYNFLVNDTHYSLLGSMLNFGAALICIIAGLLINAIGRKTTMLLILIPFTIGWGLLVIATTPIMLIIGRTLIGIGCGAVCVACPVYVGEIAEKEIRGKLGSFFQLLITSGILIVYLLGAFTTVQVTSGVCLIIPIVFAICVFFCPESPTYYVMKNNTEGAKKSLKRFRNDENSINNELNELIEDEKVRKSQNAMAAMNLKSSKKALIIAVSLMFFQQLSGINAVIFYTNAIFSDANVNIDPKYATILVGIIQVIATFISTMTVDKVGRKILLMISFGLMGLCTLSLGIYYAMDQSTTEGLGWISLVSLGIFIIAFSLGAGPLPWLCISEIFSSDVRAVAGSVAGTTNWILAFLVTITYPPVRESIGPSACFVIFAVVSFIAVIFAKIFVPETKGKSIAEIQKILGDH